MNRVLTQVAIIAAPCVNRAFGLGLHMGNVQCQTTTPRPDTLSLIIM